PAGLDYSGVDNCYHNLKCLWAGSPGSDGKDAQAISDLETFRERVGGQDEKSFVLASSPWDSPDPVRSLRAREIRQAFKLKTDVPQLRQTRNRGQLIGVERCVWGNSYEGLVALADPALGEQTPRASERIVDPKAIVQSGNVYQTLRQAVEAA